MAPPSFLISSGVFIQLDVLESNFPNCCNSRYCSSDNSSIPISVAISIALFSGGGLEIVSGSQVELTANTRIDGAVFTNNGTFNCQAFVISGSSAFVNASGSTLGIGSADGITSGTTTAGNIQTTGGRTFNSSATYVYNGTTNQVTGNGLPMAVQVLSISSFGTSGNNTVTLTTTNTTT